MQGLLDRHLIFANNQHVRFLTVHLSGLVAAEPEGIEAENKNTASFPCGEYESMGRLLKPQTTSLNNNKPCPCACAHSKL